MKTFNIPKNETVPVPATIAEKGPAYISTPEEEILSKREKTSSKELGGGINETIFVELKDDGAGVFKPDSNPSYYSNERAAYLVDRFLNFGLVPPTTIRTIDGRVGSFQQFIADAQLGMEVEGGKLSKDDRIKLNIFDLIISNRDRHGANYLIKDGKIVAIDHGYSFRGVAHIVNLRFRFRNDVKISDGLRDRLDGFVNNPQACKLLEDLLLEIFPADKVADFFKRLNFFVSYFNNNGWVYQESGLGEAIDGLEDEFDRRSR